MSGVPGYMLENSSPPTVVPFPVGPNWNLDNQIAEENEERTTPGGLMWATKLCSRRELTLPFGVDSVDLEFFRDLHRALGGAAVPFYIIPDVDASPQESLLVRKEQQFDPRPDGVVNARRWYRYDMQLSLELRRMYVPLKLDGVLYPKATVALYEALPDAVLITDESGATEFEYEEFAGGILLSGTPINVFYSEGWIYGQIATLKNADITPYLVAGTADYYDFYGV